MALELLRTLMPVTDVAVSKQSAETMKFSIDCLYVGKELGRIVEGLSGFSQDKLEEGLERLRVLEDSSFEDVIVSGWSSIAGTFMLDVDHRHWCVCMLVRQAREERLTDGMLDTVRGFIDTTQQEH